MPVINGKDVRAVLLEVIRDKTPRDWTSQNMQARSILEAAAEQLQIGRNIFQEQVLLTEWHELFRTGYLAWGYNLESPYFPFCHPTARGTEAIEWLNRDPSNPSGYLAHLHSLSEINNVAASYLDEALACYSAVAYKAAAVMIGAAAEAVILELRDICLDRIARTGGTTVKGLEDWKLKTIMNAIRSYLEGEKRLFSQELREEYEAYWPAFAQQIRAARNEAGHPTSIDPITPDAVRASFLIFPELAKLATKLKEWLVTH